MGRNIQTTHHKLMDICTKECGTTQIVLGPQDSIEILIEDQNDREVYSLSKTGGDLTYGQTKYTEDGWRENSIRKSIPLYQLVGN